MELLCRQLPCRLAPASRIKCPRQESNLDLDLRRVACESATLRGQATEHRPRAWPESGSTELAEVRAVVANNTVIHPAPRRGIEPRLAVSRTAVLVRHTRKALRSISSPSRDRTWSCSFGGCRADPAHSRTIHAEPTTGFAPASSGLQDRRLSQSSHVGKHQLARARGVEPRWAVLEAAAAPRRTLV